ncbi:Bardet-Biedl syndrome 5 protein [Zopfochytrium polystomum]|nr:Bardet-Biedl syndrome 5 protein [Zopfochytrium polystomum]
MGTWSEWLAKVTSQDPAPTTPYWQDRLIRFDVRGKRLLEPRSGEHVIAVYNSVEDIQGNPGSLGTIFITTLRIIWVSDRAKAVNLSIGWATVTTLSHETSDSILSGTDQRLQIIATFNSNRFGFNFAFRGREAGNECPIERAAMAHAAYTSSWEYRDIKVGGINVDDAGELELLEWEWVYFKRTMRSITGISRPQGAFYVTNIRIAWTDERDSWNSISVPFSQLDGVETLPSPQGYLLVLSSRPAISSSQSVQKMAFQGESSVDVKLLLNQIQSAASAYAASPIFGIQFEVHTKTEPGYPVETVSPPVNFDTCQEAEVLEVDQIDKAVIRQAEAGMMYGLSEAPCIPVTDGRTGIEFDPAVGLARQRITVDEARSLKQLWRLA